MLVWKFRYDPTTFGSDHGARRGEEADCKSYVCSSYSQTAASLHAAGRQRHSQQATSSTLLAKMMPNKCPKGAHSRPRRKAIEEQASRTLVHINKALVRQLQFLKGTTRCHP